MAWGQAVNSHSHGHNTLRSTAQKHSEQRRRDDVALQVQTVAVLLFARQISANRQSRVRARGAYGTIRNDDVNKRNCFYSANWTNWIRIVIVKCASYSKRIPIASITCWESYSSTSARQTSNRHRRSKYTLMIISPSLIRSMTMFVIEATIPHNTTMDRLNSRKRYISKQLPFLFSPVLSTNTFVFKDNRHNVTQWKCRNCEWKCATATSTWMLDVYMWRCFVCNIALNAFS